MNGEGASFENPGLRPGESAEFTIRGKCVRGLGDWNVHRLLGYAPSARGLLAQTAADDASARDPAATLDAIVGRAECRVSNSDRTGAVAKFARAALRHIAKVRR